MDLRINRHTWLTLLAGLAALSGCNGSAAIAPPRTILCDVEAAQELVGKEKPTDS